MKTKLTTYDPMVDEAGEEFKDALVGWTVVSVGMTNRYHCTTNHGAYDGDVEGGLTLILHKNGMLRKVILGYTELGEWIEHVEEIE